MDFVRFADQNTALNDIDDRKADKPLSAPKLPDTVVPGTWVCVENDQECSLYFGASNQWLKMTIDRDSGQ